MTGLGRCQSHSLQGGPQNQPTNTMFVGTLASTHCCTVYAYENMTGLGCCQSYSLQGRPRNQPTNTMFVRTLASTHCYTVYAYENMTGLGCCQSHSLQGGPRNQTTNTMFVGTLTSSHCRAVYAYENMTGLWHCQSHSLQGGPWNQTTVRGYPSLSVLGSSAWYTPGTSVGVSRDTCGNLTHPSWMRSMHLVTGHVFQVLNQKSLTQILILILYPTLDNSYQMTTTTTATQATYVQSKAFVLLIPFFFSCFQNEVVELAFTFYLTL